MRNPLGRTPLVRRPLGRSLATRSAALALFSSTAMLLTTGLAAAQSVDEAGAGALEASLDTILEQLVQNAPQLTYSFDGDIEATPSGSFYQVVTPQLTIQIEDVAIELPANESMVTPLANGWQRTQWDYPPTMRLYNPRGDERIDITFSSTDNELTYAPEYEVIMGADVSFETINAVIDDGRGDGGTVSADSLALFVETSEEDGAADTYRAVSTLNLTSFAAVVPDENVTVSIGALELSGETESQRLDLFKILQETVAGLDSESDAFVAAYLGVLRDHRTEKWLGTSSVSFDLSDLTFSSDEASGRVGQIVVSAHGEGLDQPTADLSFALEVSDMASPQLPPPFAPIIPTLAELDIQASNAPLEVVMNTLYDTMGEPGEPEIGAKGLRMGTGNSGLEGLADLDPMMVLGLLLNSDALLEINNLLIEAPIGYIAVEGTVDPEPGAAFQAVANITLDIAGLPEMISFAQGMGGEAAQAAGLASVITAMGRDGTDEEGTAIKEFDFQLTAGGQMLLNGNDMSAMMGIFQ